MAPDLTTDEIRLKADALRCQPGIAMVSVKYRSGHHPRLGDAEDSVCGWEVFIYSKFDVDCWTSLGMGATARAAFKEAEDDFAQKRSSRVTEEPEGSLHPGARFLQEGVDTSN